jgi:hypothetical protein
MPKFKKTATTSTTRLRMSQDPQLISYLMLLRFGSCKARKD